MNMLTNKVPFGLLNTKERELFLNAKQENCKRYVLGEWLGFEEPAMFEDDFAHRLKLKEGEWYTLDYCGNIYTMECIFDDTDLIDFAFAIQDDRADELGSDEPLDACDSFRPALPQEIELIQPKFKKGDVVVSDEFEYDLNDKKGYILYRFKNECIEDEDGDKSHDAESLISASGAFEFNADVGANDNPHKATNDQTKQLELEEMKHGKIWNGEGYDDYLICGMTINEFLEGDYELEYASMGGNYEPITESKHKVAENLLNKLGGINLYRLKPKDAFVDVKLMWNDERIGLKHPNGDMMDLVDVPVRIPIDGHYIEYFHGFDKEPEPHNLYPIMTDGSKATHARFCKVGE